MSNSGLVWEGKFQKDEIERQAVADYDAVAGKIVLISEVQCYDEDNDLVEDVALVPPAIARIDHYPTVENDSLIHWNGEWLDPYLDVTILEPHPALAGLRPSWAFGVCRSTKGEVQDAPFTVASPELQERYKDSPGLDHEEIGGCAPAEGHRFLKEQIEAQVLIDYRKVAGKVVLLSEVDGYDEDDNSDTIYLDPPALARIDPYSNPERNDSLIRWTDEGQLDPYLDVSILEPHPALARIRPSWTFGTCRSIKGEVEEAAFKLAPPELQEKYKNAPGLDQETLGGCAPQPAPAP